MTSLLISYPLMMPQQAASDTTAPPNDPPKPLADAARPTEATPTKAVSQGDAAQAPKEMKAERPSQAAAQSVVIAQTLDEMEVNVFGITLPKVEMPDPLPTSPFLKPA